MTLSSPNEPTEGTGGARVVDSLGETIGTVANVSMMSEDLARVAITLDPDVQAKHRLQGPLIDVEASWLNADPEDNDRLLLDRPLDEALSLQGFNVAPEVPGREPVFENPETEPL